MIPEPLPTLSEDFPKIFRRSSPPIRSQEICDVIFVKLGLYGPMRQTNEIFGAMMSSFSRPTIFNNQSEAAIFRTTFRRFSEDFRRCSPPIRSQEICDVIFVKLGLYGPTVLLMFNIFYVFFKKLAGQHEHNVRSLVGHFFSSASWPLF